MQSLQKGKTKEEKIPPLDVGEKESQHVLKRREKILLGKRSYCYLTIVKQRNVLYQGVSLYCPVVFWFSFLCKVRDFGLFLVCWLDVLVEFLLYLARCALPGSLECVFLKFKRCMGGHTLQAVECAAWCAGAYQVGHPRLRGVWPRGRAAHQAAHLCKVPF